jgi:hypothetical protein
MSLCLSLPSKLAQPVTLLTCIREVLGLILDQNTDYTDRSFSWVSSAPPDKDSENTCPKLDRDNFRPSTAPAICCKRTQFLECFQASFHLSYGVVCFTLLRSVSLHYM